MSAGAPTAALGEVLVYRVAIESTTLSTVAYDDATSVLDIEFKHGGSYRYFMVPRRTYDALLAAESKGRFFNHAIRGRFAFTRLDEDIWPSGQEEPWRKM